MTQQVLEMFRSFLKDEEGASAIEYGLIVGLIAVVIVTVLIAIGGDLDTLFGKVSTELQGAAAAS